MTPCEKLGYKIGDRFEVVKSEGFHSFEIGQEVSLIEDDGTETPHFQGTSQVDTQWVDLEDVKPINSVAPTTPKNPIEYLKAAHADGDMIDPAAMLRECYGITKTERVVVEWSEATKREIKVGDKVRIVGNKMEKAGAAHHFEKGKIVEITEIDPGAIQPYRSGTGLSWLAADDVELI